MGEISTFLEGKKSNQWFYIFWSKKEPTLPKHPWKHSQTSEQIGKNGIYHEPEIESDSGEQKQQYIPHMHTLYLDKS